MLFYHNVSFNSNKFAIPNNAVTLLIYILKGEHCGGRLKTQIVLFKSSTRLSISSVRFNISSVQINHLVICTFSDGCKCAGNIQFRVFSGMKYWFCVVRPPHFHYRAINFAPLGLLCSNFKL